MKSLMKLRPIRRIYKKHFQWERNLSQNISLLEVITFLTIVVCLILNLGPLFGQV